MSVGCGDMVKEGDRKGQEGTERDRKGQTDRKGEA